VAKVAGFVNQIGQLKQVF